MATYFHGNSEIQATDGLQTLVLMNPGFIQYSDTPTPHAGNVVFLNSARTNNSVNSQNPSHAPPAHMQQFVGIPLQTDASQDPNHPQPHPQLDVATLHGFAPRMQYNLWNTIDPSSAARDTPRVQQGLSLSLSSQQAGYGSFRVDREVVSHQGPVMSGDDVRVSGGSSTSISGVTNGVSGMQSVLPLSSKYLKAAQDLLDEVVNVNGGNFGSKSQFDKKSTISQNKLMGESSNAASGDGLTAGETSVKPCSELSTSERQEIQMKKAKLINMLDEVEQRYRQYHHQMLIVISSFEEAAGIGSARTYTARALQTISKQFRCLKDAITGQIKACNKSLGEEDSPLGGRIEGSRLKFMDNHFRQQRALQELGMTQHNAWRPQRGLPERSVSVLRAWLFEHFLHPYPKDSDKHMLAKQTGLTRSQVSNWFINARVRLWKPMVEEMYLEEMKELEQNGSEDKTSKSSEDVTPKYNATRDKIGGTDNQPRIFNSKHDNSINQNSPTTCSVSKASTSTSPVAGNAHNHSPFSLIGSSEFEGTTQGSPKKPRQHEILHSPNDVDEESMSIKFGDERQSRDGYSFMGSQSNFIAGFGQYPIGEIGRFDAEQFTPGFSGNGVSLTLALPHCENLSLSGAHQTLLSNQNMQLGRRVDMSEPNEFGTMSTSAAHSSSMYDNINLQNQKRFAAQPLPDFVA